MLAISAHYTSKVGSNTMHLLPLRNLLILALCCALPLVSGCNCEDTSQEPPTPEPPTPAPSFNRGFYLDMTLDSQDRIWLAYQNGENTSLEVARGTGEDLEWERWTVEGQGEVVSGLLTGNFDAGNYASIAVDDAGLPHVVHWDKDGDRLRWATKTADGWDKFTVDEEGGKFASLGIRNGNEPIVSYYSDGDLKVAVRNNGAWVSETVDSGEEVEGVSADVGRYSDLLVVENGTVYIAYYDTAAGDLKVAHGIPGNWNLAIWASEGDVGHWPALSEEGGSVYVSYLDAGNKDLVFGRWTGTSLETEVVDDGDFVGADSAHSWVDGTATIFYHDGVNNDAKVATQVEGGGWEIDTHMNSGAVGFFNSLETDSQGNLVWSCFNHTSTDLIVQRL